MLKKRRCIFGRGWFHVGSNGGAAVWHCSVGEHMLSVNRGLTTFVNFLSFWVFFQWNWAGNITPLGSVVSVVRQSIIQANIPSGPPYKYLYAKKCKRIYFCIKMQKSIRFCRRRRYRVAEVEKNKKNPMIFFHGISFNNSIWEMGF